MRARLSLPLLLVAVVLVMVPRFNQQDWGVGRLTGTDDTNQGDADQYIRVAEYLSGTPAESLALVAPFTDRPLVPAVAATLPGSHMTGINLINIAAVLVACLATFFTSRRLALSDNLCVAAAAMLGVSFPVFFYGAIGYVDPVVIAMLSVGLLLTVQERWAGVLAVAVVAVFAKESAVVLALVAATYLLLAQRRIGQNKARLWAISILAASGAAYVMSRAIVPHEFSASWQPATQRLSDNLRRTRGLAAVVLTLGLPAVIVAIGVRRADLKRVVPHPVLAAMGVGVALGLAQLAVALPTAFLDGRHVWGVQPYLVIVAAIVLDQRARRSRRTFS